LGKEEEKEKDKQGEMNKEFIQSRCLILLRLKWMVVVRVTPSSSSPKYVMTSFRSPHIITITNL